jgi:hypothetical protein
VLHYLHKPNPHTSSPSFDPYLRHVTRPELDGAIMQAPVSDRQAINQLLEEGFGDKTAADMQAVYDKIAAHVKEAESRNSLFDILLPLELTSQIYPGAPISCRRWTSLASPKSPQSPSEDDLFSSDLSDEQLSRTFGMVKSRGLLKGKLVVLYSGADASVPPSVDKEGLLKRWRRALDHGGKNPFWDEEHSGIIPHASHALSNDDQAEPRKNLCKRVLGYVHQVEQQ